MDFHLLEQFLQLAQFEHMSETADFFNISQPALSKSIARLESELDVKLFDRVGRRVKLNKNGENFARYAAQAMKLINAGILSTRSNRYDIMGSISIRCFAFAPILTDCISDYSRLNPFIDFSIYQNASTESPSAIEDDFILCADSTFSLSESGKSSWVSQPLLREPHFLIVSESCPMLQGLYSPFTIEQFRDVPFIAMAQHDLFFVDITHSICLNSGFSPKILFRTDHFLVKAELVRKGLGAAIIPMSCLEAAKTMVSDLIYLPVSEAGMERTVSLMRRKKSVMTEAALDFWNFVLEYFNLPPDTRE